MKNCFENQEEADVQSSRVGSEAGSSRNIFKIGQPAVYISPKLMPESNSYSDSQSIHQIKVMSKKILKSEKKLNDQTKQQRNVVFQANKNQNQNQQITCKQKLKYHSKTLTLMEAIIFCFFLICSLKSPKQLIYVDGVVNFLCLAKIIIFHVWLIKKNSLYQKSLYEDKVNKEVKAFNGPQYETKLYPYQLLQIWSIMLTIFIYAFYPFPLIISIFNFLRYFRLMFPFFILPEGQAKTKKGIYGHMCKIFLLIFLLLFITGLSMQLLLYNIQNYYCLSRSELSQISNQNFNITLNPQKCGVAKGCESANHSCRNIFSFVENLQRKQAIQKQLNIKNTFSKGILESIPLIFQTDGQIYKLYKQKMIQPILFPLFILIFVLILFIFSLAVGQWIRSEEIQTSMIQKRVKQAISEDHCFSQQLAKIKNELESRKRLQKIATIIFNIVSLLHPFLLISQNLNFDAIATRNAGIMIGVYFIIWTFLLGLALYYHFSDSEEDESRRLKTFILTFEVVAYLIMLGDYVLRIGLGVLLFEQHTPITPFSCMLISFRFIYVLFNNGFDQQISVMVQKMLMNLASNLKYLSSVFMLGIIIGLNVINVKEQDNLSESIRNISLLIGKTVGLTKQMVNVPLSQIANFVICLISFGFTVYIYKTVIKTYMALIKIDKQEWMEQLKQLEEKHNIQQIKNQNPLLQLLTSVQKGQCYKYFKIIIVIGYLVLSGINFNVQSIEIVKLVIDSLLLLDFLVLFLKGRSNFLIINRIPKILFLLTQIFLILSFPLRFQISPEIVIFFRLTRGFLLISCIQKLHRFYSSCQFLLFQNHLKLYKLFVILLGVLLMGLTITSLSNRDSSINATSAFGYSVLLSSDFLFSLNWKMQSQNLQGYQILTLSIIYLCFVTLLNGIIMFFLVSYFNELNRKNLQLYNIKQSIQMCYMKRSQQIVEKVDKQNQAYYSYITICKILLVFTSLIILPLVSSRVLESFKIRQALVTTNLIIALSQIFIYFFQYGVIRKTQFSKIQCCLLFLSLPGSFFMYFPVIKFSSWIQLSIIIRICLLFSMLRIIRIFRLLKDRLGSCFSSEILRRITKAINFAETGCLVIFIIILILPFAGCISSLTKEDLTTQLANILGSSTLTENSTRICVLILKFLCSFFIFHPLKLLFVSLVISYFLQDSRSQILRMSDKIHKIIIKVISEVQPGSLCKEHQFLFVPLPKVYKLAALLSKSLKESMKQSVYFSETINRLVQMNLQVYCFSVDSEKQETEYGLLVSGLLYEIYTRGGQRQGRQKNEVNNQPVPKKGLKNARLCNFNLKGYYQLMKYRLKLRNWVAKARKRVEEKRKVKKYGSQAGNKN